MYDVSNVKVWKNAPYFGLVVGTDVTEQVKACNKHLITFMEAQFSTYQRSGISDGVTFALHLLAKKQAAFGKNRKPLIFEKTLNLQVRNHPVVHQAPHPPSHIRPGDVVEPFAFEKPDKATNPFQRVLQRGH